MSRPRPPRLLTIAGSDSGGGAGIQADLKTFAALGGYGMTAITAITAQNTLEVRAVHPLSPQLVAAQIDAVFEDIGVDALKVGMLANAEIAAAVAQRLAAYPPTPTVLDPVLVAKSGDRLLASEAIETIRDRLLPRTTLVTPNLPEAEALSGLRCESEQDRVAVAQRLVEAGASAALITGGHGQEDPLVDLLFDGERVHRFTHPRLTTRSDHGTGCTLSAAIAAGLGGGMELVDAVGRAGQYVEQALKAAFSLGGGRGPVNHFYRWR